MPALPRVAAGLAALASLVLLTPATLPAQSSWSEQVACGVSSPRGPRRVVCQTSGPAAEVALARDLSGRCREGMSWGHTGSAIWTSRGCRGDFRVTYRPDGAPGLGSNTSRRITCGKPGAFVMDQCPTGGSAADVRVARDLSDGRCVQGTSWVFNAEYIRTARGCRAEFEVTYRDAGTAPTRVVACGGFGGGAVRCRTEGYARGVRLVRDHSGGRCRQGTTWGHTETFIWVNQGCRGEFEVTYRTAGKTF